MNEEVTAQTVNDLCTRITKYIEAEPGRSQNKLALAIGISPAVLSSFMRGVYAGSIQNTIGKIQAFFALENERQSIVAETEYVATRQAEKITRLITLAHAYRTMSVIVGPSGIGKTKTLMQYAKGKPNVFYIQCTPYMRGKLGFLRQISYTTNIGGSKNIIVLFNKVSTELSKRAALIILDDAQTLSTESASNTTVYECIRTLHDHGIGFVLAGNARLRDRVTTADDVELYQQFASRSRILMVPETFSKEDVAEVIGTLLNFKLKPAEFDYLYEIANQYYGSLRLVVSILTLAVTRANAMHMPLSLRLLQESARHIVSQRKPEYRNPKKKGVNLNAKPKETAGPDSQPVDDEEGLPRALGA